MQICDRFCKGKCFLNTRTSAVCILASFIPHQVFFFLWRCVPTRVMASSFLRFLDHAQRRTTIGRTPLDELSARRRDLYLTIHNTYNRQHIHAPDGIRTHDLSRRAGADLRLRPRGHWDRLLHKVTSGKKKKKILV